MKLIHQTSEGKDVLLEMLKSGEYFGSLSAPGNKNLIEPGKSANAGGVTVSGLEMSQNKTRFQWSRSKVDTRLQEVMKEIHTECLGYG